MKLPQTYLPVLTALAFLSACQPQEGSRDAGERKADLWEYTEFKFPGSMFPKEDLNKFGSEGWELVSVIEETGEGRGHYQKYTFKRRLR